MRQHQLMWEPVLPLGGRPILTRVNSAYMLKKVVVDRVDAEDGPYDVLHLGTGEEDEGKEKRGGKKMKSIEECGGKQTQSAAGTEISSVCYQ